MTSRLVLAVLLTVLVIPSASSPSGSVSVPSAGPGQTATLLSDGRWLFLGGESSQGSRASAFLWDPRTQTTAALPSGLKTARAWHTATVLSDGQVLIVGGIGPSGVAIDTMERFDPEALSFEPVSLSALEARAFHSATLLTDGRVLIAGGQASNGEILSTAELWDPSSDTTTLTGRLTAARRRHVATLLPTGGVLVWGGDGADDGEVYDAGLDRFAAAKTLPADDGAGVPATLAGSLPVDGASGIDVDVIVALRFSKPLRVQTVNDDTLLLSGPGGVQAATVTAAEGGRLAFVTPSESLTPGSEYTLSISGPSDVDDYLVPLTTIRFTTAAVGSSSANESSGAGDSSSGHHHGLSGESSKTKDDDSSIELDTQEWSGERRDGKPYSRWQDLPPLQAPAGTTALAGQVLKLNGQPLASVTLTIGDRSVLTDDTGRFLLTGISAGYPVLNMNGGTANRPGKTYGAFDTRVHVTAGQTNALPFTIWMPLIDTRHATRIPVPTTSEVVATTPRVPGLEARIPAGVILKTAHGPLTSITLTQIPVDRPPFPLPEGSDFFFTPQTHGAEVLRPDGSASPAGVRFVMPNYKHLAPGVRIELWNYALDRRGWHVYGHGTVTRDGRQIVPDPGAEFHRVGCVLPLGIDSGNPTVYPPKGGAAKFGDPVDLATGLFVMEKVDLFVPDVIPIEIKRTYRQADNLYRPLGVGTTFDYQLWLVGDPNVVTFADLVLPDFAKIRYNRTSPGTDLATAVMEHTGTPTKFYKSVLTRIPTRAPFGGWDLALVDGTVYEFVDGHPGPLLSGIRDRLGNKLTIVRGLEVQQKRISRIITPNGRWVEFVYGAYPAYPLIQVRDNAGRTVNYEYDGGLHLIKVTDVAGGVSEYTYDAFHRMVTLKDPRAIVYLTNEYDAAGRVSRQTQADGTTYQFAYTLDANGKIIQTDATDPRGNVRRVTFNAAGYPLTDTWAHGTAIAQTTTYQRDATSNRITSMTDALNRTTAFTYDTMGNVLTVMRLSGTPNVVTTTMTYQPTFQRLASVTDPLNHTTSFAYDAAGNLTTITNPLGHQTTLTYNTQGRPLTVTTPAGTTTLTYDGSDLATVTDATGKATTRFSDAMGRLTSITSPLGQRTRYEYDALNQLKKIIDPLGAITQLSYDPNGNLLSVTDARSSATSYTYNTMDRVATRSDPLLRAESYSYDNSGNPTSFTDRKGQVTSSTYDALNRRTQVTYQDGSTTVYTFDAGNRITQIVDSVGGTITRTYDGLDRLTQETTPTGSVSYTYDAADRRTSMTVAGQPTVSYAYDNADRLTQITQGAATVAYTYDTAGRRTSLTLPNGLLTEYVYDPASRLTGLTYKTGSTTLGTLTYGYDANSQRRQVGGTWARTAQPQPVASATYNAANHQVTFAGQALGYDLNGNLTSDGVNTYTWNARNQLATITGPTSASFGYDGAGRRRQKTVGGTTTSFLYDGLNPVQEQGAGVTNLLTGLGIDEVLTRTDSAGTQAFLADALGSTLALADNAATVQTEYTYEPFGATTTTGTSSGNPFDYTGRESDGTGLKHYRARYYHPGLQRFISEDPIGFQSRDINLYRYVGNSPMNYTDPSGLWRWPSAVYQDAERAALQSGLTGGDYDAYKHCVASCELARENGQLEARFWGWVNEKAGDWNGQRAGDRVMDDFNNGIGRSLGLVAKCFGDCQNECRISLNNGRLTKVGYGSGNRYPYRPPPDLPPMIAP